MSALVFYNNTNELATLTNTFSVNGTPTDPTTITLIVTDPAGTATTYTFALGQITKTTTGVYTKDVSCSATVDGTWNAVWVGTGTASDVQTSSWTVFGTDLSKRYCSVEEVKSRLHIPDTADDLEIGLAIEAASRQIDEKCQRHFWRATDTRIFRPCTLWTTDVDDLVSVTTLKTDAAGSGVYSTTWATADYQLWPPNTGAWAEQRPYTRIKAIGANTFPVVISGVSAIDERVQVVGVFGWPKVPQPVKQACLIITADLLNIADAPFGVMGFGEFGMRIRDNPRAEVLLTPYMRNPVLIA